MDRALTTPRLVLRPLDAEDADELFTIRGDAVAMRHWDWPADQTVGETREAAARMLAEAEAGVAVYRTARLADGRFVGLFDLSEIADRAADLGFLVVRRLWGQGLATEGAGAMAAEAKRRGLRRLTARIHLGNTGSEQVLTRLGFQANGPAAPRQVGLGRTVICQGFSLELL